MKRALLSALLALLLGCAGCHRNETLPETATPRQQVVETTVAHRQQKSSKLVLPAHVVAIPTSLVHMYPLISGRVLSLRILPGQQVYKGEEIGSLQSSDVSQARSDFEKAKIEAARADLQLARAKQLLAHDVMAQRDYDDLKALAETAHAELDRTRQALHLLGFKENDTSDIVPLVAPISGVVLDVGTGAGELQRSLDNATPIATIANIRTVWVVGDLYPRDQSSVRAGQPASVSITGYPGLVLHGTVQDISDSVDPVTLTLKVRVVLANPGYRLKPDMFASMTVTTGTRDVIVVPATAVIRDGDQNFVFVEASPGRYERRNVVLGSSENGNEEVVQGLHDGDEVVTAGAELLREGGGR